MTVSNNVSNRPRSYSAINEPYTEAGIKWSKGLTRNPVSTLATPRSIVPWIPVGFSGQSLQGKLLIQGPRALHHKLWNIDRSDWVKVPLEVSKANGNPRQAAEAVKYGEAMSYASHPDNKHKSTARALSSLTTKSRFNKKKNAYRDLIEQREDHLEKMKAHNAAIDNGQNTGTKHSAKDLKKQQNYIAHLKEKRAYLQKAIKDPSLRWDFTMIRNSHSNNKTPKEELAHDLYNLMTPLHPKNVAKNPKAYYSKSNSQFVDRYTGNKISLLLDTSNPKKPQLIIGHASSGNPFDSGRDGSIARRQWANNVANYTTNIVSASVEQAIDFGAMVRDAVEQYNESIKDDPEKAPVSVVTVGHSRGGMLAQLDAAANHGKAICANSEAPNAQMRRRVKMLYTQDKKKGTEITQLAVKDDFVSNQKGANRFGAVLEATTGAAYPRNMGSGLEWEAPPHTDNKHSDFDVAIIHHALKSFGDDDDQVDASQDEQLALVPKHKKTGDTDDELATQEPPNGLDNDNAVIKRQKKLDFNDLDFDDLDFDDKGIEEEEPDDKLHEDKNAEDEADDLLDALSPKNRKITEASESSAKGNVDDDALDIDLLPDHPPKWSDVHDDDVINGPETRRLDDVEALVESDDETDDDDLEPEQPNANPSNVPNRSRSATRASAASTASGTSIETPAPPSHVAPNNISDDELEEETVVSDQSLHLGPNPLASQQTAAVHAARTAEIAAARRKQDMEQAISAMTQSGAAIDTLKRELDDASSDFRKGIPTKWIGSERFDAVRDALRQSSIANPRSMRQLQKSAEVFFAKRTNNKEPIGFRPGPTSVGELKRVFANGDLKTGSKKVRTAEFLHHHTDRVLRHRERLMSSMEPVLARNPDTHRFTRTEVDTLLSARQMLGNSPLMADAEVRRLADRIDRKLGQLGL